MDEQNNTQDASLQQDGVADAGEQGATAAAQPQGGEPANPQGETGESVMAEQATQPQSGAAEPAMEQPPQDPQAAYQQPQQGAAYQLPPGYAMDPATGQVYFTGQPSQQPPQQPVYQTYAQPGVVYVQQQPSPEELAAQQAAAQQRYGQVVNSVEQFLEGDATVSDVVKTLYTTTSQDDQLWKGIIVGAAAAVLLTSDPVRKSMGKTIGGLFPGLKENKKTGGAGSSEAADAVTEPDLNHKE